MKWLVLLSLVGLCVCQDCPVEEEDSKVYLFGYGYGWGPYESLNEDGELMGLGYDITRSVCRIMKKKCEHSVSYSYSNLMDGSSHSTALNNGWYDALANFVMTPARKASYAFFGQYGNAPVAFMYIRNGNSMDTVNEIKNNANKFGFRTGNDRTSQACLEKYLGISLGGKSVHLPTVDDLEDAVQDRDVDVIFISEIDAYGRDIERVGGVPIVCASGGMYCITRKDMAHKFAWYDEGVRKLRANGDYKWLCNINSRDIDARCMDD